MPSDRGMKGLLARLRALGYMPGSGYRDLPTQERLYEPWHLYGQPRSGAVRAESGAYGIWQIHDPPVYDDFLQERLERRRFAEQIKWVVGRCDA